VPTMLLGSWQLDATMYDGEVMAGPVCTLCAEDNDVARNALKANLVKAHSDLQKIARAFFMPEYVDEDEAVRIAKKPR